MLRLVRSTYKPSQVWPLVRCCTPRRYSSTTHDNNPEVLERDKRQKLSMGQHEISTLIEDAPGWNESLATTSEAHIKADRSNMSTEDLQEKTIRHLLRRNDSDDWPKATGSMYVRDEVMGPLGCAHVGDAEGVSDPEGDGQPVVRIVREEQLKVKQDLKPTDSET